MSRVQSIGGIERAKTLLITLLLIILAVAVGLYLGNWIASPDWRAAVRFAVMGVLMLVILVSPLDGMLLWMMVAPFGEATFTEIWRILNFRMPPGIPDLTPDRLAVALLSILFVAHLGTGRRKLRPLGSEMFMAMFCIMVLPAAAAG